MFEGLSDAAVVDVLTAAARAENAQCARRLAAIGELYARRSPEDDTERLQWAIDGHENVVAEVSAALRVSRQRASAQLNYAIALRDLPKVAQVFAQGEIDFRVMSNIVARTANIEDSEVLAKVDAAVAKWVSRWTTLSKPKLQERIDWWVAKFDPAAVRLPKKPTDDRSVMFLSLKSGLTSMWATVSPEDAVVIDTRLDELAATVCVDDSRTADQRRADAIAALAGGRDRLACDCGSGECPGTANAKPLADIVIHVLAEQGTVDGTSSSPGFMAGHGVLPAASLRDLAARAKLKPLVRPKDEPEPGYRPSAALAEFVRWRDMTCRFPGCDRPAEVCDVDHTVPHPLGPTHPSNLKLLCRAHHLLKTFYVGPHGWADQQFPDGTVVWTAPTGHRYTTYPGGSQFFRALAIPTGKLTLPGDVPAQEARGLMMPRRRRTRADERNYRRSRERRLNEERIAEKQRQRQAWLAARYKPPPF